MKITKIRNLVNMALAGEMLTFQELKPHLDYAIDEINDMLNSTFPVFSELESEAEDYNYFPDKYIRQVVIPGAAWHFYVYDEEGVVTAQQYQLDFENGKFKMLRDYSEQIPEEYQAETESHVIDNPDNMTTGDRGLKVYGDYDFL